MPKHKPIQIEIRFVHRGCYYAKQEDGDMQHGHGRSAMAALVDFLERNRIANANIFPIKPKRP